MFLNGCNLKPWQPLSMHAHFCSELGGSGGEAEGHPQTPEGKRVLSDGGQIHTAPAKQHLEGFHRLWEQALSIVPWP